MSYYFAPPFVNRNITFGLHTCKTDGVVAERICRSKKKNWKRTLHVDKSIPKQGNTTVLTVDYRIKVHMDLQADKSPVVVKGPFFPRVVNPRYRIRGTMCNARIQSSKTR
jgi:hypothetical protein